MVIWLPLRILFSATYLRVSVKLQDEPALASSSFPQWTGTDRASLPSYIRHGYTRGSQMNEQAPRTAPVRSQSRDHMTRRDVHGA